VEIDKNIFCMLF